VNEEFLLMLVIELEVRHGESVLLGDRCCELSVIGYRENGVRDDGARRQRSETGKPSRRQKAKRCVDLHRIVLRYDV